MSSQPTPDLVAAATGLDLAHDALAAAERAGVIEIEAGQVRFTHPLLASAVYARASTHQRRAVHRALAHRATDPEERSPPPRAVLGRPRRIDRRGSRRRCALGAGSRRAGFSRGARRPGPQLTPPTTPRESFAGASRPRAIFSTPVTRSARRSCSWRRRPRRPGDPRGPTSCGAWRTPRGWRSIVSGAISSRAWTTRRVTSEWRAGSGWISRGRGSTGAMSPRPRPRPKGPWRSPGASKTHP